MLAKLDSTLKALQQRILLARWVRTLRGHIIFGLLAIGVAILVTRSALDLPRTTAALSILALALCPLTAWLQSRRNRLSDRGAAAWLDLRAGGDGSIVTAMEREDPRWKERVEYALASQPSLPRVAMDGTVTRTMPAVAFLILALWIEMPRNQAPSSTELFEGMIETLEEKLDTLEEVAELEPETAEELRERLEQLEVEALDGTPESFFEAADSLEEAIEENAFELAEEATELEQKLAAVADADEALHDEAEGMLRESITELDELGFTEGISSELESRLELPEGTTLDGELMNELSKELQELLRDKLEGLQKAGLVDPGKLRKIDPKQLAKMKKAAKKLGRPCKCEECIKAGKKSGGKDCEGDAACHNAACLKAGECQGGGT